MNINNAETPLTSDSQQNAATERKVYSGPAPLPGLTAFEASLCQNYYHWAELALDIEAAVAQRRSAIATALKLAEEQEKAIEATLTDEFGDHWHRMRIALALLCTLEIELSTILERTDDQMRGVLSEQFSEEVEQHSAERDELCHQTPTLWTVSAAELNEKIEGA